MDRNLAPWQKRDGPMYLSEKRLLNRLVERGVSTPADLAEDRFRENVIRLQCRLLARVGAVVEVAEDTFEATAPGEAIFTEEGCSPWFSGEDLVVDEELCVSDWRLTDFSKLDPTDIKQINLQFFEDPENDYRILDESPAYTRRKILGATDWKLNRLLREFPRTESLSQQCAHWMRAFAGIHTFPDANHRTGMASLYGLLKQNDVDFPDEEWPGNHIERAVLHSKIIRGLHSNVKYNSLWLKDELYVSWHRYFRNFLLDCENRLPMKPTLEQLRSVINHGRENGF